MKKTVLVLSAAVALSVLAAPSALAQDRKPVEITAEKACGVVTLTFKNPAATTHVFRWNAVAGKKVTDKGSRTGTVTVRANKTVKETIKFAEDEFKGEAAVTVAVIAGPDSDIQKSLDVYPVGTNCEKGSKPTETPDPTPTPTPKPEQDIDCDEVSGPEAQRILDADRSDPNNLDNDHDGIACDVDEVPVPGDPAPADPGVVVNNNVAVPSGGVATGGGPAWAFK